MNAEISLSAANQNSIAPDRFIIGAQEEMQFLAGLREFRAIKTGSHLADAQNYLTNKIPAAKQQAAAQGAESAMNSKFEAAKEAFNNVAFFAGDGSQIRGAAAGTRTADK